MCSGCRTCGNSTTFGSGTNRARPEKPSGSNFRFSGNDMVGRAGLPSRCKNLPLESLAFFGRGRLEMNYGDLIGDQFDRREILGAIDNAGKAELHVGKKLL